MIFRPEISACDQCGVCCTLSPCLLSGPSDVERLADFLAISKLEALGQFLQLERTSRGWQVRMKRGDSGACVFLKDNRCSVQPAKPTGGRDFKCWDLKTFQKEYLWTDESVQSLTGVMP